jgi:hypothetical protein
MADLFDIFELYARDSVRWIGTASSLAAAETEIGRTADWNGPYLILNQKTGQKIVFNRNEEGHCSGIYEGQHTDGESGGTKNERTL